MWRLWYLDCVLVTDHEVCVSLAWRGRGLLNGRHGVPAW